MLLRFMFLFCSTLARNESAQAEYEPSGKSVAYAASRVAVRGRYGSNNRNFIVILCTEFVHNPEHVNIGSDRFA